MLTVLLPNYKTPELTKLCLRALRKNSDFSKMRILAVDNASNDESVRYLRSLPWIELIEREPAEVEKLLPPEMHSTALDLALRRVETEFVLSLHTDTILLDPGWQDYLMRKIGRSGKVAGVGSWKLERTAPWKQMLKRTEDGLRGIFGRGRGEFRFLRSHCALYRTELLRKFTRGFGDGECAGSSIHKCLLAAGYELDFLPVEELSRYMVHLNHATLILNPEVCPARRTGTSKAFRMLQRKMETELFAEVLRDDSLDR